eukprot:CAMPEP_0115067918 /NCGR_PEP_ID=MMETSP0227-20121206/11671_1 /TAXON_ID=89957 /ORGANISM="Polarella glacialis, Strain CCMP 1383" /LENGTH=77 /DNA_ID=CAMNT_0002454067 /DNA_START=104 /DNA_END=337 /DNA_ORIENTATION=-
MSSSLHGEAMLAKIEREGDILSLSSGTDRKMALALMGLEQVVQNSRSSVKGIVEERACARRAAEAALRSGRAEPQGR